ncbi:hypothetical protein N665_0767s0014 [Sinapis alba]|nr:hypothetical protein N665_0767s0014 [Sinapis alba]
MSQQRKSEFRRDDPAQRIDELNNTVARLDESVEYIRKGHSLVVEASKVSDAKIKALGRSMQALNDHLSNQIKAIDTTMKAVLRNLEKIPLEDPRKENQPPPIYSDPQVIPSTSEYNRRERELGYRSVDIRDKNRDSLLRKVEMPMFGGYNPYGWISQAERYFRVTRYNSEARLDLVTVSLDKDAMRW